MLEARQRHRQLRAKQRGAVAPRHGPGRGRPAAPAARRQIAAVSAQARDLLVKAVQFAALIALNQLGYRVAVWLDLPVPGKVAALIVLFSVLSRRIAPARWIEKAMALLIKHLPLLLIPVVVGIMTYGDLFLDRGLATALTLLGSVVVGIAIAGRVWRFRPDARMRVLASLARTARSAAGSIRSFLIPIRLSPS
jgi:holin-like protein